MSPVLPRLFRGWAAAVVLTAPLATAEPAPWSEPGYGVTLRPPANATALFPQPPGALGAWRLADGAYLRVRILESEAAIGSFEKTQALGWVGLTVGQPVSIWLDERTIAGRPGLVQVVELRETPSKFLPPTVTGDRHTYGQALLKLDMFHVALAEVFVPGEEAEATRERLAAIADAVSLVPPGELLAQRREMIERAASFLRNLDREAVMQRLPARLDFAVVPSPAAPGVGGAATRRVLADPLEAATLSVAASRDGLAAGWSVTVDDGAGVRRVDRDEAWLDGSGSVEAWSRLHVVGEAGGGRRGGLPGADAPAAAVTRRTGVRNGTAVDVIATEPPPRSGGIAADVPSHWEIPERLPPAFLDGAATEISPLDAYLSRLDVLLLPELLPREVAADYAFYALDADSLSLSLRFYRVEPRADGGADVTERPTPAAPPVRHRVDADGRLVEVVRADGVVLQAKR